VKNRLCRLALCAATLFSLSLAVHAQTPAPMAATSGSAAPTTPAPAPAVAPKPTALPNIDAGSSIVNDPNITGAFKVSTLDSAAMAPAQTSRGDTAWIIVASALVMLMTPGLAFFYGGLVRSKNVLNTLMMSFVALGIITVQWMLWGYSVAFGPTPVNIFGHTTGFWHLLIASPLSWMGLRAGGGPTPVPNAPTIPGAIFMMFQMTFAIITPALISGAIAERMKFGAYCIFILLWATFFYDPLAHMVWDGGYIGTGYLNAIDFAGGTVVHISSGVSSLTLAFMLGKRRGHGSEEMRPHNVPMVLLGATLLWFGWFGFNAGSQLAADGVSTAAFINTHIATAAAAMSWICVEWIRFKKPTAVGFASGAVAGLVAITPACGWVNGMAALVIGILVSPICLSVISLKGKLNIYDDALDVFGVHAAGGMWGALATGLFADSAVNPLMTTIASDGKPTAINGPLDPWVGGPGSISNWHQPGVQIEAVVITIIFAVISTLVWGTVTKLICGGLRASADDEEAGLDITEHGEVGYGAEGAGPMPAFVGVD
jgi:Amt family ammonium transporter